MADNLKIVIQADTGQATTNIQRVTKAMNELDKSTSVGVGKGSGWLNKTFSPQMAALNPGLVAAINQAKNQQSASIAAPRMPKQKDHLLSPADVRNLSFAMMPLMRPGSPWGTMFAGRQLFGFFSGGMGMGMLGGAGAAAGALAALTVAGLALKSAFENTKKAYEDAVHLFQKSAQLGIAPSKIMAAETIGKTLGLSGGQIERMLEMSRGGTLGMQGKLGGAGIANQPLAAGFLSRVLAENQDFWNRFSQSARDFHVVWSALEIHMESFGSKLGTVFLPVLTNLAIVLEGAAASMDKFAGNIIGFLTNVLGIPGLMGAMIKMANEKPIFDPFTQQSGFGGLQKLARSRQEHMGLVIGGPGAVGGFDYFRRTADNTGNTASNTMSMLQFMISSGRMPSLKGEDLNHY